MHIGYLYVSSDCRYIAIHLGACVANRFRKVVFSFSVYYKNTFLTEKKYSNCNGRMCSGGVTYTYNESF